MKPYWEDGGLALYLGDCREILPTLGTDADLIVADPPYEETAHAWDRWPDGWIDASAMVSRSLWCFGSLRMYLAHGPEFLAADWRLSHDVEGEWDHIVWEKHNGSGFQADRFRRVHEIAAHWYRGEWRGVHHEVPRTAPHFQRHSRPGDATARGTIAHTGTIRNRAYVDDGTRLARSVLKVPTVSRRDRIHPKEKPVDLLVPLIEYACPPGGLVVDPFAGSGSTLDAARQCGRRAIGIEANEAYAEKAAQRLQQLTLEAS